MQKTREQILTYLRDHPPSSAREISHYLNMTPANIRYHLDSLKESGLIQITGKRQGGGAGRPVLLYSLTTLSLGDHLIPLLETFLEILNGSATLDENLELLADHLAGFEIQKIRNQVERFNQGVQILNTMNYHASWEASPQGPRVELRHCPYRDIPKNHPILCRLDEQLLKKIFKADLVLTRKRVFGGYPFSPCVFHLAGNYREKG